MLNSGLLNDPTISVLGTDTKKQKYPVRQRHQYVLAVLSLTTKLETTYAPSPTGKQVDKMWYIPML